MIAATPSTRPDATCTFLPRHQHARVLRRFVSTQDGKPHRNSLACCVLRVVVLMKLTLFGLSATECFAIMQMQYKLRNPDSSGFKVKDDFSQFKTGDEGDEASLDVHEVSSGAEAISEDDSNAEAFKN